MKSPLSAGAGALVMVVALFLAGRSESEPTKAVTPPGRIAIVNLEYVIKNYDKAMTLDAEIQEDIAQHQREDSEMRSRIREIVDAIQDPRTPAETKAKYEKYLRRPGVEDGGPGADFKRALAKKTEERMVAVYSDVRRAAQRYAAAHGIELVLCYNDPAGKGAWIEYDLAATEPLKVKTNTCTPLYVAPGIDISPEIVAILNDNDANHTK